MNGILIVNKNIGYTSRDVVNLVGGILKTKKIGHTGTLDPMASGVLVLCVGNALKISELLTNHDKEYIAGITLGVETDTLDMDGIILKDEEVDVDDELIIDTVNSFLGTYKQVIPKYSAVKVNGKRLYEYARNNQDVDLPSKEVNIKEISIINNITHDNGKIYFEIKCIVSKGTYIRALVRDIGFKLGVPAVMNSLVRTKVGAFKIENSYNLDEIKSNNFNFISITEALPLIPMIKVDSLVAKRIKNGVIIDNLFNNDFAFIVDEEENLLALYRNDNGKCRVYKMFV